MPKRIKRSKNVSTSFSERYNSFCYRLLGKRLEDDVKNVALATKLRQANIGLSPGMYKARNITTGLLAATLALFCYSLFLSLLFPSDMTVILIPTLAVVCGLLGYIYLPFIVSTRRSNRAAAIEKELPFTLSELAIMASTGSSPVEIFRRIAKRNEKEAISVEFKKIVYKMDIEGKDLISAISEGARESPSNGFRETLWDMANMIHQGGKLDDYLRSKADDMMRMKRENQKSFINKLGTYSDLYITLVLIGVLFISIGAFLIDAMGSDFGGLSSDVILLALTWGMIPVSVAIFGVLISSEYSKVE